MRKSYIVFGPIFWFFFGAALGWNIWMYGPQNIFCDWASILITEFKIVLSWANLLNQWVDKIPYNTDVILTMAQVEGVLASIAVPLGLDMISKISYRYNSTAVNTYFKRSWLIRWYPFFMLGILLVTLLPPVFFNHSTNASLFVLLASVLFIVAVVASAFFVNLLRSYTGSGYLLERIFKGVEDIIK